MSVKLREVTAHKLAGLNESIAITATDAPGSGGANHLYMVEGFNTATNPSCPFVARYGRPSDHTTILFQNGPVGEAGPNGISNEALIAVVMDRLECFQAGPYACDDNARALAHLQQAMNWLQARTRERLARGVEGTSEV